MEIRNIVATADLGCSLNLKDINLKVPSTKYNPTKFPGLVLRIKNPKATAQLFTTGKIVCLGTKSIADLQKAGREFTRLLTYLGYEASFNGFTVKNMVGSCDVGFKINIEQMADTYGGIYAPEMFPALDYRIERATLLIFHSGKLIITGTKTQEEIAEAFAKIYPIMQKCQK